MPSRRISPWGRVALVAVGCVALAWAASAALVIAVSRMDRARPSQAIIVLGAAQYGGRPSPVLRARLDHAIELWQAGMAPRLILTGGVGRGDTTSEAAVGRRYALRKGVPDAAILVEDRGRTTIESMHAVSRPKPDIMSPTACMDSIVVRPRSSTRMAASGTPLRSA